MLPVKVIVPKLNKRSSPVIDLADKSNIVGEVYKDFSFLAQKTSNAIGDWYRDRDNSYYWGAAIMPDIPAAIDDYANNTSWAHRLFGIIDIWNNTGWRGENTRVALLDTGISAVSSFSHIIASKAFDNTESTDDHNGHGTTMAGIVAGNGSPVFGVAPSSGLLIAKVDINDNDSLVQAVHWAREQKADIISMSFELKTFNTQLYEALLACKQQGIALLAAAGNGGQSGEEKNRYPASYDCCYSIGACEQQLQRIAMSNLSRHLCMLSPGKEILTIGPGNEMVKETDTSIATAFASGVAALLLSVKRKTDPAAKAINIFDSLIANATRLGFMTDPLAYGHGVINPAAV